MKISVILKLGVQSLRTSQLFNFPSLTKPSSKQELDNEDNKVAVENHAPNANGIAFPFGIHRDHTDNIPPAEVEPDSSGFGKFPPQQ